MRLGDALLDDASVALSRVGSSSQDHLDIHAAALLEPDAAAELARLRTRGFVSGAVRVWSDGQQIVELTLHRFGSTAQASLATEEIRHALRAAAGEERVEGFVGDESRGRVSVVRVREFDSNFVADVALGFAETVSVSALVGGVEGVGTDSAWAARLLRLQLVRLH